MRRPPIGLPLAGPGVARCSHRFRQSLADSAPAAILNDSGINTRGVEKKSMQARHPLPSLLLLSCFSLASLALLSPFSSRPSLALLTISRSLVSSLSLTLTLVHATTDTELHRLLFPPRGTLTPFRSCRPPPAGIPGATTTTIDEPSQMG